MRVLWFTNIMLPAMDAHTGQSTMGSGHWMTMLAEALKARGGEVELAIATAAPGLHDDCFTRDGIEYAIIGQRQSNPSLASPRALAKCKALVDQWRPDLVHVHGTERFFGLLGARRMIKPPVVISIQGLISACHQVFYGGLTPLQVLLRVDRLSELARGRGLLWGRRAFAKLALQEREIIARNRFFIGRTAWDHAQVLRLNERAVIHHADELLRPPFHQPGWALEACRRRTIICTNANNPRRGVETLLAAVELLKHEFPDIQLQLAGEFPARSGYGRYLRRRIHKMGLAELVNFPGYLDAERLARALCDSHAFVCPSLIENSPNSLCEAMLLGQPCIASDVGGIPSLVTHGENGLLFPPGDAPGLASRLCELFSDDHLARRLGMRARETARQRHDPERVVNAVMAAYQAILNRTKD